MNTLGKDFKAAFGSVWALFGVLISAVAVFNWLSGVLKIGLSALFAQLLSAFRSVFHPIIEFLTGWAIPWLPFLALPEWKDGLVLWFAVGGALFRSLWGWLQTNRVAIDRPFGLTPDEHEKHKDSPALIFDGSDPLDDKVGFHPFVRVVLFFASPMFWPIAMLIIFQKPIRLISSSIETGNQAIYVKSHSATGEYLAEYDHDLRTVFAMQIAAVIAVVVILVLLNASGVG